MAGASRTCSIITEDGLVDLHRLGAVEEVQGAAFGGGVVVERAPPKIYI